MSNQITTKEMTTEPEKQPEQSQLSQELKVLAVEIKGLISTSAKAKIKIGELLIQHKEPIRHGDTKAFYKSIEMAERTAQYYMQIASNKEVQKLKREEKLDGLNMSEILKKVGMRVNIRGANNENAPQSKNYTAKGFGNFEFKTCRSTAIFTKEYESLATEVEKLQKELETLRSKTP